MFSRFKKMLISFELCVWTAFLPRWRKSLHHTISWSSPLHRYCSDAKKNHYQNLVTNQLKTLRNCLRNSVSIVSTIVLSKLLLFHNVKYFSCHVSMSLDSLKDPNRTNKSFWQGRLWIVKQTSDSKAILTPFSVLVLFTISRHKRMN